MSDPILRGEIGSDFPVDPNDGDFTVIVPSVSVDIAQISHVSMLHLVLLHERRQILCIDICTITQQ